MALLPDLSKRLTDAERTRITSIILDAARKALEALERADPDNHHWPRIRTSADRAFHAAVLQSCDKIIQAAKIPTYVLKQQEKIKTEQAAARKALSDGAARKALADELRSGRRRLRELEDKIAGAEEQAPIDFIALPNSYPAIPLLPRFKPHKEGEGLPESSGVYFLWSNSIVEYVGRSTKLNGRLRLGGHHVLRSDHRISLLPFDREVLDWAES